MGKYPVLKPREVVVLPAKPGFVEVHPRGSHRQFRHPEGQRTPVPFHKERDVFDPEHLTPETIQIIP
ncbi:MAG: addiction module toxin, HicA family [Caldilineae bacterium]|nr:MAG: addiction module toxin, HicA family [Caldilineae bacterium]